MSSMRGAALLCVLATPTSCATYLADRGRDLADVFTATIEQDYWGVHALVGPLHTLGLASNRGVDSPAIGLIGGRWTTYEYDDLCVPLLLSNLEFGDFEDDSRRKSYSLLQVLFLPPLPNGGYQALTSSGRRNQGRMFLRRLGAVEIAGGFGLGCRAGVNVAEAIDFLVGGLGIDLFADDVAGATSLPDELSPATPANEAPGG